MNNWRIEVWGDYACFSRPEMKVERVSYDVMTPSAARAIFDAILWKPAISWQITKIEVLNPIQWVSARRNEVGKIATAPTQAQMQGNIDVPLGIFIEDHRQQRAGLFLKDVRYRIHGRFDFIPPEKRKQTQTKTEADNADESEAKYAAMFERRARKGQCFHRPYLGCREFACYFRLVEGDVAPITETINPDRDLGWMLYDMNYANPSNPTPEFFHARLKNNAINTDRQTLEIKS